MNHIKNLLITSLLFLALTVSALPEQLTSPIQAALKVNDWDTALDLAEDLVDEHPKSSAAHFLLAQALRIKMEDVSRVRAMFSLGDYKDALAEAIKLDPANIDARTEEIGFLIFAPGVAGGDKEQAQQRINDLRAFDAFSALEMEVQLAAVNKDAARQELLLKEMLGLKPKHPNTLMSLAAMAMQRQDYQATEAWLVQVADAEDAGWLLAAQYQRAKWRILAKQQSDVAIQLLDDYQRRLEGIETTVNLPHKAAALWRQALAYENQGDKKLAIELLKSSLQADQDFEPAEDDLDRLSD